MTWKITLILLAITMLGLSIKNLINTKKLCNLSKILAENHEKRLKELERIIQNQPLIKKYQKTLDIFLKNAQD